METTLNILAKSGEIILTAILVALGLYSIYFLRRNLTRYLSLLEDLYYCIFNFFIDYTHKAIVISKNILLFPLGVDHRIFKNKYKRMESINGRAKLIEIKNDHPITPKANHYLLCMTIWAISAYVFWAMKSSLSLIYTDSTSDIRSFLPYALAGVVFLLDVWIVRSYGFVEMNRGIFQRIMLTILRFGVSACIAGIAAFHILSSQYSDDIDQEMKSVSLVKISNTDGYKHLEGLRNQLLIAEYYSNANKFCLNLLSTGAKDKASAMVYHSSNLEAISLKYKLPPEVNGKIGTPGVGNVNCSIYLTEKEPTCKVAWADNKTCVRLSREAKKNFESDVDVFGVDITKKRGWFGVEESFPGLLSLRPSNGKSLLETYRDEYASIFGEARSTQKHNGDMALAVRVIESKLAASPTFAILLLLAPIMVFGIFEFSLLIIKTTWGESSIDLYLSLLDQSSKYRLNGGNGSSDPKAELSEHNYTSDFNLQDHVGSMLDTIGKLLQPLIESKIMSIVLFSVLIYALVRLAMIEASSPFVSTIHDFFSGLFDSFNGMSK